MNPPAWFSGGAPRVFERESPPLGLLYLAAYVHAHSDRFAVRVLDVGPEGTSLEALGRCLASTKPFVVGVSAMTIQLQGARDVAMKVRETLPKARIFLGGAHVSADPGFVERHAEAFDHGITGEAETVLLDSLVRLASGTPPPRIQQGQAPVDLDALPVPDRSLVRQARYLQPASLVLSRGCPYHCYFCASPAAFARVRHRSSGSVLSEMEALLGGPRGRVAFADDTFTLNRPLVLDLCSEIHRRSLRPRWSCVTRIDRVDEELVRQMRRAGCDTIGFGIESGNERVRRDVIRKGDYTNEDVYRAVALCQAQGMRVNAFFLIGNPTETDEELDETEAMISRLGLNGVAVSLPIPFPGSALYAMAERDGVIDTDTLDRFARKELGWGVTGVYPLYTPGHDREALLRRMKRIFRRFYLRPTRFLDFLRRDLDQPRLLVEDIRSTLYLLRRGGSRKRPFV
ncbi:MAG: radical SAM protein [Deltaproteobacteria bacterium]|nr:radical SAM protein [Deltaproteobacteria bacterium]